MAMTSGIPQHDIESAAIQDTEAVEPNGPILGGKGYIPAQTIRKAYFELDETAQTRAVCSHSLRQLIDENQDENNFDEHTDAFLLKFLRHRKFDVEDAYRLLERYYANRESKPEIFRNLTRKNVKKTLEQGILGVLPQRDQFGRVVLVFNFAQWNLSLPFHFEKVMRVFVYTLEKVFESDETQVNGVVIICDLTQLSVLQTKSLRSSMITKIVEVFQDNFPFRLTAVHLLNPSWHFKLLWKMTNVLSLLKLKMAERVFIHDGDLTSFHLEFPLDMLPKDLGGSCPEYENDVWVQELLEPEQEEQDTQMKTAAHIQLLNVKTIRPVRSANSMY